MANQVKAVQVGASAAVQVGASAAVQVGASAGNTALYAALCGGVAPLACFGAIRPPGASTPSWMPKLSNSRTCTCPLGCHSRDLVRHQGRRRQAGRRYRRPGARLQGRRGQGGTQESLPPAGSAAEVPLHDRHMQLNGGTSGCLDQSTTSRVAVDQRLWRRWMGRIRTWQGAGQHVSGAAAEVSTHQPKARRQGAPLAAMPCSILPVRLSVTRPAYPAAEPFSAALRPPPSCAADIQLSEIKAARWLPGFRAPGRRVQFRGRQVDGAGGGRVQAVDGQPSASWTRTRPKGVAAGEDAGLVGPAVGPR